MDAQEKVQKEAEMLLWLKSMKSSFKGILSAPERRRFLEAAQRRLDDGRP